MATIKEPRQIEPKEVVSALLRQKCTTWPSPLWKNQTAAAPEAWRDDKFFVILSDEHVLFSFVMKAILDQPKHACPPHMQYPGAVRAA